ncbi:hypothetical protein M5W98_28705, partial [Paenibacillus apiarius]|nr:hypothetical protein [Paenibacillus apiarius]
LEAAASLVRRLAEDDAATPPPIADEELSASDWVTYARELHPALGDRQAQVLSEVAKAHPQGTGTGPIWRAIDYEQTNTYLALGALSRQGLVQKDESAKPHRYYLGPALIEYASRRKRD